MQVCSVLEPYSLPIPCCTPTPEPFSVSTHAPYLFYDSESLIRIVCKYMGEVPFLGREQATSLEERDSFPRGSPPSQLGVRPGETLL